MKIIDNIKKVLLKIENNKLYDELRNKDNIIKEQENIINEFKFYLNRVINENEKEIVDINKIIGCCEANSNKPVICYREANNAKLKIKSSIADSKQLLNKYNFKYIPETNFNIIKLDNQVGG